MLLKCSLLIHCYSNCKETTVLLHFVFIFCYFILFKWLWPKNKKHYHVKKWIELLLLYLLTLQMHGLFVYIAFRHIIIVVLLVTIIVILGFQTISKLFINIRGKHKCNVRFCLPRFPKQWSSVELKSNILNLTHFGCYQDPQI